MVDKTTIAHSKGQKHPAKTKWEKVINKSKPPLIDEENPELVKNPQIKFKKSVSKQV